MELTDEIYTVFDSYPILTDKGRWRNINGAKQKAYDDLAKKFGYNSRTAKRLLNLYINRKQEEVRLADLIGGEHGPRS